MLPIRCIVGHVEKAMNPLCVAITYGAIEDLEPLIKRLEAINPRSKGEQECLDAAKNHGSWVSHSEIQALFDKTPPHRLEGFMESKLHCVLDEAELKGDYYGTPTNTGPKHVQEVPAAAQD